MLSHLKYQHHEQASGECNQRFTIKTCHVQGTLLIPSIFKLKPGMKSYGLVEERRQQPMLKFYESLKLRVLYSVVKQNQHVWHCSKARLHRCSVC